MIRSLSGSEPHPSHGGWENFLTNECEVRDQHDGVTFYGSSNCNYIVFPGGELVANYGYHGKKLMNDVRAEGAAAVLATAKDAIAAVAQVVSGDYNRPLAAAGLTSYRCRTRFGYAMIGAKDDADAMNEAVRAYPAAKREDLEAWDGKRYVPAVPAAPPAARVIVKAARAIMGEGRFVLWGYDAAGKEVFGLGHKAMDTGSGVRWAMARTQSGDLKRIQAAYADHLAEIEDTERQEKLVGKPR